MLQYSSHYEIKISPKFDLIVFKRKENLCKDQCGWDVGFLREKSKLTWKATVYSKLTQEVFFLYKKIIRNLISTRTWVYCVMGDK